MGGKTRKKRAKFLLDECVPDWALVHLWARGYNGRLSKGVLGPNTDDTLLLKQAKKQGRVFVTLDRGIKQKVKTARYPGIVVIIGDELHEDYVCKALDTLLQWGAKRREDYEGLYIEISEHQLSIRTDDGKTLVVRADGSLTLREEDGTECHDTRTIEAYLKAKGFV